MRLILLFLVLIFSRSEAMDLSGALLDGLYKGITAPLPPAQNSNTNEIKTNVIVDEGFPEPSRLELKAMQTRKFNKPSSQVFKSIIELYKDKDISCYGNDIYFRFKGLRGDMRMVDVPGAPGSKQGVYKGYFKSYEPRTLGAVNCINGLEFELSTNPVVKPDGSEFVYQDYNKLVAMMSDGSFPDKPKTTIVRLRIKNSNGKQSYNPERYQKIFKDIADGLFVDAIQLTPAEMQ